MSFSDYKELVASKQIPKIGVNGQSDLRTPQKKKKKKNKKDKCPSKEHWGMDRLI